MAKTKQAYKAYAVSADLDAPKDVLEAFLELAEELEDNGYILRTKGDENVDCELIERLKDSSKVELYLPWENFNDWEEPFIPMAGAYEMAWKYHPAWAECDEELKRLHASTSHIIMGKDLKSLVDFLICYTPKGQGEEVTDQAVRIADTNLIPVFDFGLGIDYTFNQLDTWFNKQQ